VPLLVTLIGMAWRVWPSRTELIGIAVGIAGEAPAWLPGAGAAAAWLYLVVFGSLIGFKAYMVLLARAPAALATGYNLVNPVIALALGVGLGGEAVSPWEWGAVAVAVSGVVLLVLAQR
jgi:drug/metabolite transporter (DMT)-like permease